MRDPRSIPPTMTFPASVRPLACMWLAIVAALAVGRVDAAGIRLGDICRVKGQEINTLHGLGLVIGLKGTGDGDVAPTSRALSRFMQLLGGPMAIDASGQLDMRDVADAKNVAMVFVTAKIPAVGAQQGDPLDVTVAAINAKSLEGGYLMLTPLVGPRADNPTVYALAQGSLKRTPDGPVTTAVIQGGAKMEATVRAAFEENGKVTLILDRDFASFDTAERIETEINRYPGFANESPPTSLASGGRLARAIDPLHVEVFLPPSYRDNPVRFVHAVLSISIPLPQYSHRVVINEREGIVVIGKDVELAPVLITHRNLRIEAGGPGLVAVGQGERQSDSVKLKSLADALNALDVPTEDLIAIIKTLKAKGDLFGEVVFQ